MYHKFGKTSLHRVRKYKIVKRGGLNIGILGIVGDNSMKYYPQAIRDSIKFSDPITAINDVLGKISSRTDIIVLLTHQGQIKIWTAKSLGGGCYSWGSQPDSARRTNSCK
ncbi:MAG: hypothetical protein CM1200mP10_09760 [Candidatus Neomarinimicrobiota bacterium]|nr:MAG: hypothetical protein CM1200mP10_09760 [Candidatus Neomarinimicrobiota bacterium]